MKLLIYSHFFAPSVGGVETVVLSLARGFAELRDSKGARELEVTLVTQTPAGNYDDSSLPFRVFRQPGLFQLWRLICSSDIVHVAGPALTPMILGLLVRRPVVVEHHGFQTICPNGQLLIEPQGEPCPGHFLAGRHRECLSCNSSQGRRVSWKLWLLTFVRRFLCALADANVVPTQWLGGLLQLPRVTAVPHGLDPGPGFQRIAPSSNTPVIVFLGRLVTTKGVHVLLRAARILHAQNRQFALVIIGDGPERAALEQFVADSQLSHHVCFAGRLDGGQLEAVLSQAAVVVVPSLGGEVFGMVVVENMARGLTVVASDLGPFVEVLGGAGVNFHTGDPADLASILLCLFDDPAAATRLGQLAQERALDFFSTSRMIEGHFRIYRTVRDSIKDS